MPPVSRTELIRKLKAYAEEAKEEPLTKTWLCMKPETASACDAHTTSKIGTGPSPMNTSEKPKAVKHIPVPLAQLWTQH